MTSTTTAAAATAASSNDKTVAPSKDTVSTNSTTSFYAVNSLSQWKQQLVTKEDPNHIHKTLGILVLCSYIWRLSMVFDDTDLGFASMPQFTIPTLLLHLALNASSFEFKIPAKRIASGYRIWPEYRLHSLVFLCRSLAMMLLFYFEQHVWYKHKDDSSSTSASDSPREYHVGNILILLGTMAAADWSSHTQGPQYQSGFARELHVPALAKYFFSMAQLFATSMILTGQRRYTMQFCMVIIIQFNAFLMTVRRKNLASHALLTTIYGLLILGAGVIGVYEFGYKAEGASGSVFRGMALCGNLALVLRTGPRWIPGLSIIQDNKYLLWLCMYALQEYYIRPALHLELTLQRRVVNLSATAAMIALGVYKHVKEQREQNKVKSV